MSDVNNNIEKNIHTLLEIVYSLKLGCNFEEELKNKFVNLSGYTIKKKDTHVDVTYFNSVSNIKILIINNFISSFINMHTFSINRYIYNTFTKI